MIIRTRDEVGVAMAETNRSYAAGLPHSCKGSLVLCWLSDPFPWEKHGRAANLLFVPHWQVAIQQTEYSAHTVYALRISYYVLSITFTQQQVRGNFKRAKTSQCTCDEVWLLTCANTCQSCDGTKPENIQCSPLIEGGHVCLWTFVYMETCTFVDLIAYTWKRVHRNICCLEPIPIRVRAKSSTQKQNTHQGTNFQHIFISTWRAFEILLGLKNC